MACRRCKEDLQPPLFASPRRCAFLDDGSFTPDNWNCATVEALLRIDAVPTLEGCDESLDVVSGRDYGGFLVLTRYKHRGKTSSAVHVGDFWPPRPLTLAVAERWLDGTFWNAEEESDDAGGA
jgi:hypothetical protein